MKTTGGVSDTNSWIFDAVQFVYLAMAKDETSKHSEKRREDEQLCKQLVCSIRQKLR